MVAASNASWVAADIARLGIEATARTHAVVTMYGQLLETSVKQHASGRPGPNAPTGNYRRSIGRRTTRTTRASTAEVGTNAPQGRRLEMGFYGADSLGRHYHNSPLPHFAPALAELTPKFEAAIIAAALPR